MSFRFANAGSVGYKVRGRLNIFDHENNLVFTGWTKEVDFHPGLDKIFDIYWYPINTTGDFNGNLRVYYGNEIIEDSSISFKIDSSIISPKQSLDISKIKVYDDTITADLESDKNLTDVILIPENYPLGWIFEQEKIRSIKNDETERISINYEPSLWVSDREATFYIITEDGKYFGSKTFPLERESDLQEFLYYTNKWLGSFLSKIYNPKN